VWWEKATEIGETGIDSPRKGCCKAFREHQATVDISQHPQVYDFLMCRTGNPSGSTSLAVFANWLRTSTTTRPSHKPDYQILRYRSMASSGMLRLVTFVRTDVSEELSTSFIRMTIIGELENTLAVTSNRRKLASVASYRAARRNIPEDSILCSPRREILKSYKLHPFAQVTPITEKQSYLQRNQ
jgi:hypothetical protein